MSEKVRVLHKRKFIISNEATGSPGKYDTVASTLDICEIVICNVNYYAQVKVVSVKVS